MKPETIKRLNEKFNELLSDKPDKASDSDKVKKSLEILNMIKTEMPKTMGNPNFQLIYDDICKAVKILEGI